MTRIESVTPSTTMPASKATKVAVDRLSCEESAKSSVPDRLAAAMLRFVDGVFIMVVRKILRPLGDVN